jgi:hypothetical protein
MKHHPIYLPRRQVPTIRKTIRIVIDSLNPFLLKTRGKVPQTNQHCFPCIAICKVQPPEMKPRGENMTMSIHKTRQHKTPLQVHHLVRAGFLLPPINNPPLAHQKVAVASQPYLPTQGTTPMEGQKIFAPAKEPKISERTGEVLLL